MKTIEFGNTFWHNEKNELHREDGPAIEWYDGSKIYMVNGKTHKEDGPAVIWANGNKEYWLNGIRYYTEKDFLKKILEDKINSFKNNNLRWKKYQRNR